MVEKERSSKNIATLGPFARGWPGARFFTIDNEGRKREGLKRLRTLFFSIDDEGGMLQIH